MYNQNFDPFEAAQDYYEKFQRGTLTRRGGNMDWIATENKAYQKDFIDEIKRLLGKEYKVYWEGCYFSVQNIKEREEEGFEPGD